MEALLGKGNEQPRCKVIAADLQIHWYPSYEQGVPCFCGLTTCTVKEDEDVSARPAGEGVGSEGQT